MTDTTTPPRQHGKRGLRPSLPHPELMHTRFLAPATNVPPTGDVSRGITAWGMLDNDKYGNCGAAAYFHYRMAKGADPASITAAECDETYFAYGEAMGEPTPAGAAGPDEGVDNYTFLKWCFDNGLVEAFLQLDHSNPDEVHAGMLNFHGVFIGCQLEADAEQQYDAGEPWNITADDPPQADMGHDILLVAYDENGETIVTWGTDQRTTIAFDASAVTDCWVIVTKDDALRAGMTTEQFDALLAQIQAGGGVTVPVPPPVPAPVPAPAPAPAPTPVEPTPAPAPQPQPAPDPSPAPVPAPTNYGAAYAQAYVQLIASLGVLQGAGRMLERIVAGAPAESTLKIDLERLAGPLAIEAEHLATYIRSAPPVPRGSQDDGELVRLRAEFDELRQEVHEGMLRGLGEIAKRLER